MITRINGILLEKLPPSVVLDVNGIGYEILVPMSTIYKLPNVGESALLHTHFLVREDAQQLFGFATLDERRMFRELLKASGVGPKMALTILSGLTIDELVQIISNADAARLTKLPGVGRKTAERLVIEMSDKIKKWGIVPTAVGNQQNTPALSDAIEALESLGYKEQQAKAAVHKIYADHKSCEELIKSALQVLA